MGYTPKILRFDLRAQRISEQTAYPEETALVFSSRPYPVEAEDQMDLGMAVVGGKLFVALYESQPDSIDAGIALLAGSMRALLQQAATQIESVDANIALSAGELRQLLTSYIGPAEALNASMSLASGSMPNALIIYQNWPVEAIDAGMALAGGSLS